MSWMAAFCAGVIILYCSGRLLPWHDYIFIVLLLLPAIVLRSRWLVSASLGLLCGAVWASWHVQQQLHSALPVSVFGSPVQVEGYVCSLPKAGTFSVRVDICAERIFTRDDASVSFGRGRLRVHLSAQLLPIDLHALYRFEGVLRPPVGRLNPRTRSAERAWFSQNVLALGSVTHVRPLPATVPEWSIAFRQHLLALRVKARDVFRTMSASLEHVGPMQALFIGDRSRITPNENRLLAETGTQHLMAISGLHVGMIIMLLHFALPRSSASLVLIGCVSLAYVGLVGAPASAQRAWIMAMCVFMVSRGYAPARPWGGWLFAMTCVLLMDPAMSLSAGFWYSFLAVAALLWVWRLGLMRSGWGAMVLVQVLLFLFLHAFSVSQGQQSHPLNILANLVAIPWVSLVILPLLLLSVLVGLFWPVLGHGGLLVVNEALHVLMVFFSSFAAMQWPVNTVGKPPLWLAFLALWLACLVFRAYRYFGLALGVCVVVVICVPFKSGEAEDELLVWDAGQGLAVLLHGGGDTWLYDLGPAWPSGSLAEKEILPYLRQRGWVDTVRGVILSHGDSDHVGGASRVLEALQPRHFWAGERERHAFTQRATACEQGMQWQNAHWHIEVIYAQVHAEEESSNNRSCVVRLRNGALSVLIMGDLEGEGERRFLRTVQGDLSAQFLVAGHHGSRHATSYALLKRVRPQFVIFPAPAFSRFGHPHDDVKQRVANMGAQSMHLGVEGALHIYPARVSDHPEQSVSWVLERQRNTAFWLARTGVVSANPSHNERP